jgi:predicted transcriptional regulator
MADEQRRETRFPEVLRLVAPRGINAALDELAAKQHTTRSEVVRRALLREVEANGVQLEPARAA